MADVVKREPRSDEPYEFFDRFFDDWTRHMPFRRPWMFGREPWSEDMIKVDEYKEDQALVIRAELPGIDPDKDVEITVSEGRLHIQAERREEEKKEDKGYRRREMRYGSFSRTLPLPQGAKESDVTATYNNGILEIRIPTPKESATKVPISKAKG
jgi:HSP20 family protein